MSRIHDALKRAEQERTDSAAPVDAMPADMTTVAAERAAKASSSGATENRPVPPFTAGEGFSKRGEVHKLLLERCCTQSAWNPDRRIMLLFDRRRPIVGLEEFRTLRTYLYLVREQQPIKNLLITSALPQEGKTFVALNLVQVIVRQPERRALLIDGDLRLSRIHNFLGAPSAPGLSDYLSGAVDEFSVVHRGPVDNLFFIPGGKQAPNPSELIGSGRLRLLLDRLAPAFDWIILDSPPAIPVSDAKLMAEVCDGVLFVVHGGVTPFDMAQKACQEFRDRRLLGVVVNRVGAGSARMSRRYYQPDGNEKSKTKKANRHGTTV